MEPQEDIQQIGETQVLDEPEASAEQDVRSEADGEQADALGALVEQLKADPRLFDIIKSNIQRETSHLVKKYDELEARYTSVVDFLAGFEDDRALVRYLADQNIDGTERQKLLADARAQRQERARDARLEQLERQQKQQAEKSVDASAPGFEVAKDQAWANVLDYAASKGIDEKAVTALWNAGKLPRDPGAAAPRDPFGVRDWEKRTKAAIDGVQSEGKRAAVAVAPRPSATSARAGGSNVQTWSEAQKVQNIHDISDEDYFKLVGK